jgi:hypothetical protein
VGSVSRDSGPERVRQGRICTPEAPKIPSGATVGLRLSTAHQVQGVSLRSLYKRSTGHITFTMDPVRDLLIWAIVQNRQELAGIIWAQVTGPASRRPQP